MTDDGMRRIRLLKVCDLVLSQGADRAPTAFSSRVIFVAPMMGAVTGYFCNSQASAM
jgi:hypothetical protein